MEAQPISIKSVIRGNYYLGLGLEGLEGREPTLPSQGEDNLSQGRYLLYLHNESIFG